MKKVAANNITIEVAPSRRGKRDLLRKQYEKMEKF